MTLCHENSMTTQVITSRRVNVASLKTTASSVSFLNEMMVILKT